MKKIALISLLLLTVSVSALAATARNISSGEARNVLAKRKNIFLLDVRTPEEYRQAHLKGATLIPLSDLQLRYYEVPRNRPIVVYCAIGTRSSAAAALLAQKGYREVYNMADGIVGWYRSGYPLER